jgi:HEPN domain-containing protein
MASKAKSATTPRAEASLYLAKAKQLVEEAGVALEGSRYDAAMLNSIHAGISAADAVTVALAGRRSTDPDHQRVADLLGEVGRSSGSIGERVKQLRALLGKKNRVEYESRRASTAEAADAVARAERLVQWAEEIVKRARI